MIVITLVSLGLGVAVILGLAFSLDRVGIASNGPGTLGIAFIAPERCRARRAASRKTTCLGSCSGIGRGRRRPARRRRPTAFGRAELALG